MKKIPKLKRVSKISNMVGSHVLSPWGSLALYLSSTNINILFQFKQKDHFSLNTNYFLYLKNLIPLLVVTRVQAVQVDLLDLSIKKTSKY